MHQFVSITVIVAIITIKLQFNIYNELIKWIYYNVKSQYTELRKTHFLQNKIVFWFFTNPLLIENVHT